MAIVARRLRRHGYGETIRWIDARGARPSARPASDAHATALELAMLVRHVARLVPDATCLRRALVLRRLLTDEGVPSRVHLGARPDEDGSMTFHAWVTVDGRVVSEAERLVAGYVELDSGERWHTAAPGRSSYRPSRSTVIRRR